MATDIALTSTLLAADLASNKDITDVVTALKHMTVRRTTPQTRYANVHTTDVSEVVLATFPTASFPNGVRVVSMTVAADEAVSASDSNYLTFTLTAYAAGAMTGGTVVGAPTTKAASLGALAVWTPVAATTTLGLTGANTTVAANGYLSIAIAETGTLGSSSDPDIIVQVQYEVL